MTDCSFDGNSGTDGIDGVAVADYGEGPTTVTNCTFSNNSGTGDADGGAYYFASHGNGTMTNCTFFNNSTDDGGGALYLDTDAVLTVTNCTLSSNSAGVGAGGAVFVRFGSVSLENSLVVENTAATGPDLSMQFGTITANFSLIGTGSTGNGYTLTGASGNNLFGTTNLDLGTLADNGGPQVGDAGSTSILQTQALLSGSVAIDAGSNDLATTAGLTYDERGAGFPRFINGTVDIGAYEFAPSATLGLTGSPFSENGQATVTATLSFAPTQTVTLTLTFAGSAVSGTDYNPSSSSITIPANELTGSITLTGLNNPNFSGPQTVVVSIGSATNADIGTPSSVTATLISAPTIANISPNNGPSVGGTSITITGSEFAAGATVTVGGKAATGVTVVNSMVIMASTPPGAGSADVVVTNLDTGAVTDVGGFTYSAALPTVTSPTSGPPAPGNFTATLGGDVTADGGAPILERGVLFAKTSAHLTLMRGVTGVTEVDDPAMTTGVFADNVNGLTPGTGYVFVAFATNAAGTAYTPAATFTTTQTPATGIFGPTTGTSGQTLTFTLLASDPVSGTQSSTFTFHIKWGDGTTSIANSPERRHHDDARLCKPWDLYHSDHGHRRPQQRVAGRNLHRNDNDFAKSPRPIQQQTQEHWRCE